MPVTMLPTYSRTLSVVDVSPLLYTYTSVSSKVRGAENLKIYGVNCSGVKAVLDLCAKNYRNGVRTVLCLDSYTNKKRMSSDYKSNRTFRADIAVQTEIIESFFGDFGVDVLKRPGREADDLIYSTVLTNINKFNKIQVYTGDSDIYGVVVSDKVSVVGVNSISPTITSDNFELCAMSSKRIPYNFILPHHLFYGKPSNNLDKPKLDKMNDHYYEAMQKYLSGKVPEGECSSIESLILFLKSGEVKEEHLGTLIERAKLIYPTIDLIEIDTQGPVPDVDKLIQFCSFFRMNVAAGMYYISKDLNTVESNKAFVPMLKRMYADIKNGTLSADNGVRQEISLNPAVSSTMEFKEVTEW